MTRRSINLMQFWITIGLFSIPGLAFALSGYIRFKSGYFPRIEVDLFPYLIFTILVTLLWAFIVDHLNLNKLTTLVTLQTGIRTATIATMYCTLLSLSLAFFYRATNFARIFVVLGCFLIFAFCLVMIHIFRMIVHAIEQSPNGRFSIAILGADEFAQNVARNLTMSRLARCKVACYVALPDQVTPTLDSPVLAWEQLEGIVDDFHCKELLIALPPDRLGEAKRILQVVQHLCIPSRLVLDLGEGVLIPERIFDFHGIPLLDVRQYPIDTVGYALGKRIFDIVFSSLILLFAAPLMILVALLIKLDSPGPVFFIQERISLNGHHFRMLKFRTMHLQDPRSSNLLHTQRDDQRVTRLGRFLRRISFDEFPQFINVLKGDMSVVGPRPELTFFVHKFRQEIPWYMARHNVKCGITGWAQINGFRGSDTSIPSRIEHDLYYMRNWSMTLDLKIIMMTVFNGLMNRQAY